MVEELTQNNSILILKIGGSVITHKETSKQENNEVIEHIQNQLSEIDQKYILVHGGGSYGHPIADRYQIHKGLNKKIPNQLIGLTETHNAMLELNSLIISGLLKRDIPAFPLHASSLCSQKEDKIDFLLAIKNIENVLNNGFVPVLYGDVIFHHPNSFSILSGDRIISEICTNIHSYTVSKVIYAMDQDGIIIDDELVEEISCSKLDDLPIHDDPKMVDVTGGLKGKLTEIQKICQLGIPVLLINGTRNNYIKSAMQSINIRSTRISK